MNETLNISTPTTLRIPSLSKDQEKSLNKLLTYADQTAEYEYQRYKKAKWRESQMGSEFYEVELLKLKAARNKSLLFEDEDGLWTYSGLTGKLTEFLNCTPPALGFDVPVPTPLIWAKPTRTPWPHQVEMVEKLLAVRHGGVEVGTGLGKGLAIAMLCQRLGLKAVIMAPLCQIANQLLELIIISNYRYTSLCCGFCRITFGKYYSAFHIIW